MLFLRFELGSDRYAIDTRQIVEILPLVEVKRIPQAPAGVLGLVDYHGVPVPVIDLSQLAVGRPARRCFSTRLIITRSTDEGGRDRVLGVVAEKATGTLRREPGDFVDCAITNERAPYLGPLTRDDQGLVQWIDVAKVLPAPVREMLFDPTADARRAP
jgi:chemotaxis-related protein WspB